MEAGLRQHIGEYAMSKGMGNTDKDIIDIIIESNPVWQGEPDRHRWYTLTPYVVEVNGRFVDYQCCFPHGEDSDVEDCIGGYKLDDFVEVFPQQVTTTIYKRKV